MQSLAPSFFTVFLSGEVLRNPAYTIVLFTYHHLINFFLNGWIHGIQGLIATVKINFMCFRVRKLLLQILYKNIGAGIIFHRKGAHPVC